MAAILSLVLSQNICLSSLPQFLQQQKKKKNKNVANDWNDKYYAIY